MDTNNTQTLPKLVFVGKAEKVERKMFSYRLDADLMNELSSMTCGSHTRMVEESLRRFLEELKRTESTLVIGSGKS